MKTLWFKRKTYGWGWTPATWQGWGITIDYAVIVIMLSLFIGWNNQKETVLGLLLIILTVIFIGITYKTGEKPRWQWGKTRTDKE